MSRDDRPVTSIEAKALERVAQLYFGPCGKDPRMHEARGCAVCEFMWAHGSGLVWFRRNEIKRLLREEGLEQPPSDEDRSHLVPWER